MMSHDAFVLLSYGAAGFVFVALIAWILIDRAMTKRDLERLEKAGIRRRSQAGGDAQ